MYRNITNDSDDYVVSKISNELCIKKNEVTDFVCYFGSTNVTGVTNVNEFSVINEWKYQWMGLI